MRLIRHGEPGRELPGVLLPDGRRKDCSGRFRDWDGEFLRSEGLRQVARLIEREAEQLEDVEENVRWAPCIARPWKILGIGLNYRDHAKEAGMEVPREPVVFLKAPYTMSGPFDDLFIPRGSRKTDWEVELGVVVGQDARYLGSVSDAKEHIAGYCVCHDVSEREFQLERGGQWTKGKSCSGFCPTGPYMATPDEVGNVMNLELLLGVNGDLRQRSNTSEMIFDVFYLVYYLSQFMTLEAGDLILTGTPAGVGFGMKPQRFLQPGDVVELSVEGLGEQRQQCRES